MCIINRNYILGENSRELSHPLNEDKITQMQTMLKDTDFMQTYFELLPRSVFICLGVRDLFKSQMKLRSISPQKVYRYVYIYIYYLHTISEVSYTAKAWIKNPCPRNE